MSTRRKLHLSDIREEKRQKKWSRYKKNHSGEYYVAEKDPSLFWLLVTLNEEKKSQDM